MKRALLPAGTRLPAGDDSGARDSDGDTEVIVHWRLRRVAAGALTATAATPVAEPIARMHRHSRHSPMAKENRRKHAEVASSKPSTTPAAMAPTPPKRSRILVPLVPSENTPAPAVAATKTPVLPRTKLTTDRLSLARVPRRFGELDYDGIFSKGRLSRTIDLVDGGDDVPALPPRLPPLPTPKKKDGHPEQATKQLEQQPVIAAPLEPMRTAGEPMHVIEFVDVRRPMKLAAPAQAHAPAPPAPLLVPMPFQPQQFILPPRSEVERDYRTVLNLINQSFEGAENHMEGEPRGGREQQQQQQRYSASNPPSEEEQQQQPYYSSITQSSPFSTSPSVPLDLPPQYHHQQPQHLYAGSPSLPSAQWMANHGTPSILNDFHWRRHSMF